MDSYTAPFHAETDRTTAQSDGGGVGEIFGERARRHDVPVSVVPRLFDAVQAPKHASIPITTQIRFHSLRLAARLSMDHRERRSDRTTTTGMME